MDEPAPRADGAGSKRATIVRVQALTKIYGGPAHPVHALDGVDLSIEEADFTAIMGPSGSGKSTLLYVVGGLEAPTSGRVLVRNADLSQLGDEELSRIRRREIGFIFQFFNLIPVLRARENVAMPLILDGVERANALRRADEALANVGLADRAQHRPSELSGGEQQRVALARALVIDPLLILGDEPTGNLDSRAGGEVVRLLRHATDTWGRTVVIVTHDARIAASADRIVFLQDGRIVGEDRPRGHGSSDAIRDRLEQITR